MPGEPLQTVMLIDDSDIDNFANSLLLKSSNYFSSIEVFNQAELALEYLKTDGRSQVDLIFLDLNMPRMNGLEFLEAYEQLPENKKSTAIVVMLTSSSASKDRKIIDNYKALTDFRSKPLTKAMLDDILRDNFKIEMAS